MQRLTSSLLLALLFTNGLLAADNPSATLAKELEPLKAFVGKSWKGPLRNSTPEKPVIDVMRWERALNGQAIRILHSINEGD
ncbi:MAG: hypothetical protein FJ403_00535 [Verrucomicrobia bacterium]|nr:hypothetical protein [Verrucomicrobiota bacterium]